MGELLVSSISNGENFWGDLAFKLSFAKKLELIDKGLLGETPVSENSLLRELEINRFTSEIMMKSSSK